MRRIWLIILVVAALAGGCGREEKPATRALEDKGTFDVLKEASEDKYDPPADGKLTDAQMDMHLKVKQRQAGLAKAAAEKVKEKGEEAKEAGQKSLTGLMKGLSALGGMADFLTADIRAAQELGYNTAEYQWVQGQVLEASTAEMAAGFQKMAQDMSLSALENLKKMRAQTSDPALQKSLDEQIAEMEKSGAQMGQEEGQDPVKAAAMAHNRALLKKHGQEIKALEDEIKRWTGPEAGKSEGGPQN